MSLHPPPSSFDFTRVLWVPPHNSQKPSVEQEKVEKKKNALEIFDPKTKEVIHIPPPPEPVARAPQSPPIPYAVLQQPVLPMFSYAPLSMGNPMFVHPPPMHFSPQMRPAAAAQQQHVPSLEKKTEECNDAEKAKSHVEHADNHTREWHQDGDDSFGRGRGRRGGRNDEQRGSYSGEDQRGRPGRGRGRGGKKPHAVFDHALYQYPNYTASLDGRFWSLSMWPTGERDEAHRCGVGQHKLDVGQLGEITLTLYGGVNEYRVSIHYCPEGDILSKADSYGWALATCGPSLSDLTLTQDAEETGWQLIQKPGRKPVLLPPGVAIPEDDADEPAPAANNKAENSTTAAAEAKQEEEEQ